MHTWYRAWRRHGVRNSELGLHASITIPHSSTISAAVSFKLRPEPRLVPGPMGGIGITFKGASQKASPGACAWLLACMRTRAAGEGSCPRDSAGCCLLGAAWNAAAFVDLTCGLEAIPCWCCVGGGRDLITPGYAPAGAMTTRQALAGPTRL